MKGFLASRWLWTLCMAVIVVISAAIGATLWQMRPQDQGLETFRTEFLSLQSRESEWSIDLLKLELGIADNYDDVSNGANDLQVRLQALDDLLQADPSLEPLRPGFAAYGDAVRQKIWLSEQIKASYAMLRNSASVLPSGVAAFFDDPEAFATDPSGAARPSELLAQAVVAMTSFVITPTEALAATVSDALARLRDTAALSSAELADTAGRLAAQTEVVVRERQRGNDLMIQVTAVPVDQASGALQAEIHGLELAQASSRTSLRNVVIALTVLLAIAVSSLILTLRRRYVQLDQDNHMLQQKNEDVQDQLLQSAKLSAIGQMVAGITHEINTPLSYVRSVFELIRERALSESMLQALASGSPASGGSQEDEEEEAHLRQEELVMLLDDGIHGIDEIATLVRTMKNFSRFDRGHAESFSVEDGLESALLIARSTLKYAADVDRDFDNVPPIYAAPSQLRQVFLNLLNNAVQAIESTGRRGKIIVRTRLTAAETIKIEIQDDGPGIPDDVLPRIFDPFFSTKPVGEGTGMGLSICYRIIENHGGTITVATRSGVGTSFTITLPRHTGIDKEPPEIQQRSGMMQVAHEGQNAA